MEMEKLYPKNFEKKWEKFWRKEKIYEFKLKKKKNFFVIDTPPPTVSGRMHMGHAFSYSHIDFIARYHRMVGENVFFPFGVDDNGLATERFVEKEANVNIFEVERSEFIKLCQKILKKFEPKFVQDWMNLGISCDFNNLFYSTIDSRVQKLSQALFLQLYKKGRIYRKEAPVLWCPKCQTAIAQAELKDKKLKSKFLKIAFELETGEKIVIATTRPELLPSCGAIFVHPKDKRYREIIGKSAIVPLFGQKVPILADEGVDPNKGTGVVMGCTFGDSIDVEWYYKYKLPLRISINKDGTMNENAGNYKGLKIKECREKIIFDLKEKGLVLEEKEIEHSVNAHERCDTEIEILSTPQWFLKYLDLKEELIKFGRKIRWHPEHMRKRYENWVKNIKWDWCISRQRYFGIPIPVWYCKKCGEIKTPKISELPLNPVEKKPKTRCANCKSNEFVPEKDVFDTWFTSALTPKIGIDLVKNRKLQKKLFPMSIRPQAHDIISTWAFYTIVRSKLHFNKIPWQNIIISGFVLDPKGEKMSKSRGNVVEPQEIIQKYGVDALRHWAAKGALGEDVRWSEEEVKSSKRTVIKLWNASRFCFFHLQNFKEKKIKVKNLNPEDKWILHSLQETIKNYHDYFQKYEFKKAREVLDNFFWKKFCDHYLEIVKVRLYEKNQEDQKEKTRWTLYNVIFSVLRLYAPFIPFITEELFQIYFKNRVDKKSIHQCLLPSFDRALLTPRIKKEFDNLITLISALRKYRTEKKIPYSKEIEKIKVKTSLKNLEKYLNLVKALLKIKEIEIKKSEIDYLKIN